MDRILIQGAREHNLKDIDLEIPREKLIVVTGLSGSGKSSLAFDTLYAEGQRRYVESLSAYARQFLEQMEKPDVELIEGLSPAISIEQKGISRNPRSTVGTITEIYDYLRLLFARVGKPYCPRCGREISSQTIQQIADYLMGLPRGTRIVLFSPIVRGKKGEYRKELEGLRREGFVRVRIDGRILDLEEPIQLDRKKKHTIDVMIDRLVVKEKIERRLTDSLELASRMADGVIRVEIDGVRETIFSEKATCVDCGISYPDIEPRMFSFNSPYGACPVCGGLGIRVNGRVHGVDDPAAPSFEQEWAEGEEPPCETPCPACGGARLRKESLSVKVGGLSIGEVVKMSIGESLDFLENLDLGRRDQQIAAPILKEITERLTFMVDVGLDYLTLDRRASTLSAGEGQRIRLATQIGSSLVGVMYVLDEPSIGLHQRDNLRLLKNLRRLRDMGNTVIVVEHDESTILAADHVVDMGPGAGLQGGRVIFSGPPSEIMGIEESVTGRYLSGRLAIPVPKRRRAPGKGELVLRGVTTNNLKNIDVTIPLGIFVCVTGVSGSGKSSLVVDTLFRVLSHRLYRSRAGKGTLRSVEGLSDIDKVINIDQTPIGRTPRSNAATYTGVFGLIRDLFSQIPEARMRGYKPGRFSFNVKGGRCDACQGDGVIKVEMHFLPDVYVTCEICGGKRYNRETLEIKYRGKNIHDVLDMTVAQALSFFENIPSIRSKLQTLHDVGLGYIKLGQSATTFSGGEAQRIKLSRELSKKGTGRTLYILDEPTTGLHFADVQKLLEVLSRLVDMGNTVIVIEHNLEVIKSADYIIDLGPEGGQRGGRIIATGSPEEIALHPGSYTGQYLRQYLPKRRDRKQDGSFPVEMA
ncbi:MAG: excinuclease ABC subunit UvrA [Deltaproteobacteria bacterium]|nr:excinuclease ABC subunit UvrA [Deltaproteobacteria bacterium]MBW2122617.1 excinuclease ABC subunit UvrA [Deltaproteobacteria bacterium]